MLLTNMDNYSSEKLIITMGGNPQWSVEDCARNERDSWVKYVYDEPFDERQVARFLRGIAQMERSFDLLKYANKQP